MKLTKRQIILIGVFALAAVVLVGDKLLTSDPVSGPSSAGASVSVPVARTTVDETPAPATRKPASITERITALAEERDLDVLATADALRPADAWLTELTKPDETTKPKVSVRPAPDPVAADRPEEIFRNRHALQAVMVSDGGRRAVVNGECLSVGSRLGKFVLVEINTASAVFESGPHRVTLTLSTGH